MLLKLGVALDADQHGAHLVFLGQDDLVKLTVLELVKQAVQFAHRLADGRQLVVTDAQTVARRAHRGGHATPELRRNRRRSVRTIDDTARR